MTLIPVRPCVSTSRGQLRFPGAQQVRWERLGVDEHRQLARVGDHVYGDSLVMKGGFAEYVVVPQAALARKPAELTFAESSTIPQSGAIALQGSAGVMPGARVLINGAGGGSGTFAIQLAKRLGAHVTAVDNAAKQDFMTSVGADEVVDFRRTDFTQTTAPYDLILDMVAHRSVFAYQRALSPGGTYRCVGGSTRAVLRVLTVGMVAGRLTAQVDRRAGSEGGSAALRAACRPLRPRRGADLH